MDFAGDKREVEKDMIYLELFLTFLKIGAFTFGGGYAMLAFIQQEVVSHGWMTQQEVIDFVAISESTPGPFAVNASTYVGFQTGGVLGAFCATLGVILPSFIIILIVAKTYEKFKRSRLINGFMSGLKPAVIGLIGSAFINTAVSTFSLSLDFSFITPKFLIGVALFAVFLVLLYKKVNPIIVIGSAACAGILVGLINVC